MHFFFWPLFLGYLVPLLGVRGRVPALVFGVEKRTNSSQVESTAVKEKAACWLRGDCLKGAFRKGKGQGSSIWETVSNGSVVKNPACWCRRGSLDICMGEDALEKGNDNPFHYSCLESPMDRAAWWAPYSPWGRKGSETWLSDWRTAAKCILLTQPLPASVLFLSPPSVPPSLPAPSSPRHHAYLARLRCHLSYYKACWLQAKTDPPAQDKTPLELGKGTNFSRGRLGPGKTRQSASAGHLQNISVLNSSCLVFFFFFLLIFFFQI